MKLISFDIDGALATGAIIDGQIAPFPKNLADMTDVIRHAEDLTGLTNDSGRISLEDVTLRAPIPNPMRNIICVGKNYRDHAQEFSRSGFEAGAVANQEIDAFPAVFTKLPTSVADPGATISLHSNITECVDYEIELALVIGKAGCDIAPQDAFSHIFGYTIVNDVTARDRQKNHKQWFLGKTLDGFCPMGPWLVTADEVDAENLDLESRVNGEVRQKANTRDLLFDIPTLLATISAGTTLVPGDIIATGTPAGVGIGFNPPRFLKTGDTVSMTITGLGELHNMFA